MRLYLARFLGLVFAGGSLCAIATCSPHEVPPVQTPETRPAGPTATRAPTLPIGKKPTDQRIKWPLDATPASISPKKPPPVDAGVDGGVDLPPVPDAAIPQLRDAGTPMTM